MKLTPNRRMAVFLEKSGNLNVCSLTVWLEQLYAQLMVTQIGFPILLQDREAQWLWEKIIRNSHSGRCLLKTSGAARLAFEAWKLKNQWKIQNLEEYTASLDTAAFLEWAHEYKKVCHQNNWIDFSEGVDLLTQAVSEKKVCLPIDIELIGFEELPPQWAQFFKQVEKMGSRVRSRSLVSTPGTQICIASKDAEEELRLAASKTKKWLQKNPKYFIGIVVPDLEQRRSEVLRIFEEQFLKTEFNVSAPIPLSQYPLMESALLALSFLKGKIPLEKLSQFLRSPFFGDAFSENASRVAFDVALRHLYEAEYSLERLLSRCEKDIEQKKTSACPKLFTLLQNFVSIISSDRSAVRGKKSAKQWVEILSELLKSLGWPGERVLNEEESQIQQQWDRLLVDYERMGRVLGEHTCSEAVTRIHRLAKETPFLPPSPEVSIQVLGVLEAIGIPFDYLWVTGMNREAWPPEPAPNPFIPLSIQRKQDLPRSSADRELKMARRFTERLVVGAKEIIFSYPKTVEDQACQKSLLLEHIPEIAQKDLQIVDVCSPLMQIFEKQKKQQHDLSLAEIKCSNDKQSVFTDPGTEETKDWAPALQAGEKIKGGTQILALQAACPFRAFAEGRLKAHPLPLVRLGLTPAERGEMLHQALQNFWHGLSNQQELNQLSAEDLQIRMQSSIQAVLDVWQTRRPTTLTPRYAALEKKRLETFLSRFIALEKTRDFFEVVAKEKESVITLSGLEIRIRIDRIDRLENGEEILLDYKTGDISIRNWFGDRPLDPQLPLYCISRSPKPKGLIFGTLRPDAVKYQGLTKDPNVLPGVKALSQVNIEDSEQSWEAQCTRWQTVLESTAKDFSEGVATVDPVSGTHTCRLCSLQSVCRIEHR